MTGSDPTFLSKEDLYSIEEKLSKFKSLNTLSKNIEYQISALDSKFELSQLRLQLMELQIEKKKQELNSQLTEVKRCCQQALDKYNSVRDFIGESYGIDMKQMSYDPESGQIYIEYSDDPLEKKENGTS